MSALASGPPALVSTSSSGPPALVSTSSDPQLLPPAAAAPAAGSPGGGVRSASARPATHEDRVQSLQAEIDALMNNTEHTNQMAAIDERMEGVRRRDSKIGADLETEACDASRQRGIVKQKSIQMEEVTADDREEAMTALDNRHAKGKGGTADGKKATTPASARRTVPGGKGKGAAAPGSAKKKGF